jgi:hypothetical protein
MAAAISASAADSSQIAKNFLVAPIGAIRTADITGASEWGAGLDVGYKVNPFVSLHVANLTFEGDSWGGLLVDETDLYAKAKFTKFSTDSFTLFGIAGGQRDWVEEDWGFGVGLGASLNFNKHVSLSVDYSLRAWFNRDKDSLARVALNFSF